MSDASASTPEGIASEILEYYEFLAMLVIPPESIIKPEPGGWPMITGDNLKFMGKNQGVIDLLKVLPYIRQDKNKAPFQIANHCIPIDYSSEWFQQERRNSDRDNVDGFGEALQAHDCEEINKPPNPSIATIGRGEEGSGDYIYCETSDYSFIKVELTGSAQYFRTAKDLFDKLKADICSLKLFPIGPTEMWEREEVGDDPDMDKLIDIFCQYGWPGAAYQKAECIKEVEQYANTLWSQH